MSIIQTYGMLDYLILFLIVFCETGLVVTPIPPRRFAPGSPPAPSLPPGALQVQPLFVLLSIAAVAGDTGELLAGKIGGAEEFSQRNMSRFMKKE